MSWRDIRTMLWWSLEMLRHSLQWSLRWTHTASIPEDVWAYFLPTEQRVIAVRKHPAMLAWRCLLSLADLAAFALTAAGVTQGGPVALGLLGAGFAASTLLIWDGARIWSRTFFVLTSSRMILVSWRWNRRRMMVIPLYEAVDMTFVRTAVGRLVGYGSFLIYPDRGRRRRRVSYLPYPEQLYLEVCAQIFLGDGPRQLPPRS